MAGKNEDQVTQLEGQVSDLEAQVGDLNKKLEKAIEAGGDDSRVAVELQGQVDELSKQLGEMTKTLEQASAALEEQNKVGEAITKLSPAQLEHYNAIVEKADKKKFLDMAEEEKEKEVKKRAAGDETVVIEGEAIRKSVVGESTFKVMKAQADRIAKNEKDFAEQVKKTERAEFAKKADDEYGHVPGTVEERRDMLMAIEKMEEPLKKSFLKVFEQSEKLSAAGFGKLGHGGGKDPSKDSAIAKSRTDFEGKAAEIKKRDNCNQTQAFAKARKEFPDLFKAYQEAGQEASTQ